MIGSEKQIEVAQRIKQNALSNLQKAIDILEWGISDEANLLDQKARYFFYILEYLYNKTMICFENKEKAKKSIQRTIVSLKKLKEDIEKENWAWNKTNVYLALRGQLSHPVFLPLRYENLMKKYRLNPMLNYEI